MFFKPDLYRHSFLFSVLVLPTHAKKTISQIVIYCESNGFTPKNVENEDRQKNCRDALIGEPTF